MTVNKQIIPQLLDTAIHNESNGTLQHALMQHAKWTALTFIEMSAPGKDRDAMMQEILMMQVRMSAAVYMCLLRFREFQNTMTIENGSLQVNIDQALVNEYMIECLYEVQKRQEAGLIDDDGNYAN